MYVGGETEARGRQKAVLRARAVSTNCPWDCRGVLPKMEEYIAVCDHQLGLAFSQRQNRNLVLPMKGLSLPLSRPFFFLRRSF